MKKRILLLVLMLFFIGHTILVAQSKGSGKKRHKFQKERIFAGGGLGLWLGNTTFIDISPYIGYRLTDRYSVGLGGTYMYYSVKLYDNSNKEYRISTNYYGGRVFNRFHITEYLFAHGEYELLSIEYYYFERNLSTGIYELLKERRLIGSFLVGGGYAQNIGRNSSYFLMILYNLNEHVFSPYPNPIIRFGVSVGF